MNNTDTSKVAARRGRPVRKVTIHKELGDELGIIWRDFISGFYGTTDNVNIQAVREDLDHAISYAFALAAGAPYYPATADDYVLKRWIGDTKEYDEHFKLHKKAVEAQGLHTCICCGERADGMYQPDSGPAIRVCTKCVSTRKLLSWLEVNGYDVPYESMLRS